MKRESTGLIHICGKCSMLIVGTTAIPPETKFMTMKCPSCGTLYDLTIYPNGRMNVRLKHESILDKILK